MPRNEDNGENVLLFAINLASNEAKTRNKNGLKRSSKFTDIKLVDIIMIVPLLRDYVNCSVSFYEPYRFSFFCFYNI